MEIFDFIDCFVRLEGEDVLVELARAVSSGKDWRSINGIIFRNTKDSILKNDILPFDINKSKTPDYSWIYNHNYLDPETLFLRASVGCYYDKCAFCTQSYNRYRQRSLDNVINDVLALKKVYKVNKIFFSDNSIHFNRLTQIAERIIDSGIRVNWRALSRFDLKELKEADCAKLRKANCVSLFFGLESGVQRVNDLMNKGVNVERAVEIMKQLKKYGIRSSVGSIIGFPGETVKEIVQNIKFLKDNWLHFNAGLAIFGLEHGSAVFSSPEKYSIQKIKGSDEFLYKLNYSYESKDKVPYENIVSLKKTFVIPTWKIILRELTLIYRRFVTSGI
ncbi:MAG: B12-binding domain-containing radical SAM protein [Candidatus Anammoxibacter sp.]